MFRKEFILEGLDCASCASKIEMEVNLLDSVERATMNFVTKTLSIEIGDEGQVGSVVNSAKHIINKLEPEVVIIEKGKDKDGDHQDAGEINKKIVMKLAVGGLLFTMALVLKISANMKFIFYFISYLIIGGDVLERAVRNILRGQIFDENFLMAIATIGAFAIGEYPEGVAVMLFYQVGEFFQDLAVNRSRKSIAQLMDIRPDYANIRINSGEIRVDPVEVAVGDHIIVRPGEKIPLDGIVIEGNSMVDTSALTGESLPREVEVGNKVLGGFINTNGLLVIEVIKEFGESTISRILELVENSSSKKAPTENFITRFARYYTPVVVFIAAGLALLPPLIIKEASFSTWLYKALVFLVISCPCALVISIPLGFFGGIGGASRQGILVKGGNYLEALNHIDAVVFDKTGTLTKGVFKVTEINNIANTSKDDLLKYAAYAESYSNHPIALSILSAYGKEVDRDKIEDYEEILGHGIRARIGGREILAGNRKLMELEGVEYEPGQRAGTLVYLALDKVFIGSIIISDEVKEDSKATIKGLKDMGIGKTIMLTGDNENIGRKIGEELGLDQVYTELLPDEKVEKLEEINKEKSRKGKLVFVGDGINDAPVLAIADVGVAMGGLGSDAAIEAADLVLMTDEPSKLIDAIKIAKKTNRIVWQNIIFAFIVKAAVLILGAGGLASMWEAVFADVGVALIAVFNSMRVMNVRDI